MRASHPTGRQDACTRTRTGARRAACAVALLLAQAACTQVPLAVSNTEPARELSREASVAGGSLYGGWRVFQQRCAACHGPAADGREGAPNLLLRLRGLGPHRFVDLVLRRYETDGLPAGAGAPRETLVDDVVQRRRGELTMPSWQGDPVVTAHVMDLYAYLNARAEGRIGSAAPPAP